MGRVHTLPETVINHIAAGEVIERPASVLKELLENALDAQARRITVMVQGGGIELLQVDDDGVGMDAEDAVHCFTRHATSKISTLGDLDQISTLGFRGEALPSIATVSRLQLVSRCPQAAAGTRVVFAGGALLEVETCGAAPGTSVRVSDLFYNTPARLKFLKQPATEAGHLTQCFTTLALAAPGVHMTLQMHGRVHLQAPAVSSLGERLSLLLGLDCQEQLLPVDDEASEVQVSGYIAKATMHRATRRQQFFFVNGRAVQNRVLSRALYEAYRTLLPRDRHPVACVFLTLPANEVDVNVHPAKLEVRFRQEARLYDRLRRLFQQRLLTSVAGPTMSAQPSVAQITAPEVASARAVPMLWQAPPRPAAVPAAVPPPGWPAPATSPTLQLHAGYPEAGRTILEGMPLGQLHNTYIVLQYTDGFFLVDQHAAHERVVYERLRDRLHSGPFEAQQVLFPRILELGATDPEWIASCMPRLAGLGFTLEHFGGTTYRLSSVPAILAERDYTAALLDILEVLRAPVADDLLEEGLPRVFHHLLTVMACHGAIRAHQRLHEDEIRALLHDLARTAMPFTCPHGRPVLLHIALADIEKKFLRC
ncbi:MAG: DNA mismatch repair endonuclease MutL [Candidatus Tectomicrobia bacterium]|uniref:DNA mismatch repair protein MutL n=1 Tax=Tectimicrobiota bacterium TaxID=2528274 RepID=A0A937VZG0_UNCTE|nr:DNA mismatch repair endonuclease MutL [Candidatus Tectomicrobia bacterium]